MCTHELNEIVHDVGTHIYMMQSYIEGLSHMPYITLKIDENAYLLDEKEAKSWAFAK